METVVGRLFARLARIRGRARTLLGCTSPAPDDAVPVAPNAEALRRLEVMVGRFGLGLVDEQIVLCLYAAEVDTAIRLVERAVQRDATGWIELAMIAELLELPGRLFPELIASLTATSPLVRYGIIWSDPTSDEGPWPTRRYRLPDEVVAFLRGDDALPKALSFAQAQANEEVAPSLLQPAAIALESARRAGVPLIAEIVSPDLGLGASAAARLAASIGRQALIVDPPPEGEAPHRRWATALREAALRDCVLVLREWSALPSLPPRALPLVWLAREDRGALRTVDAPRIAVHLPFPSAAERAAIVKRALARRAQPALDDEALLSLVRRFPIGTAELRRAVAQAVHGDLDELSSLFRDQIDHELAEIATRVPLRCGWDDLVVAEPVYEALCEMIARIRHADLVLDGWSVSRATGVQRGFSALFAGPPGTGKTLCASVIAKELGLDLFRVDLSAVLSKWIGETEKNLGRVFDEALRSGAAILFDEADSLFAKRTEVKTSIDRYANVEVNYLLQRIESFPGVVLLTTNREDGIDEAFRRRLSFRVRFEAPDAEGRAALWDKLLSSGCPLGDDIDVGVLGARFEMTGGHIKNAVVRAAFLAAAAGTPVDMKLCLTAAERELIEMGRLACSLSLPSLPSPPVSAPPEPPPPPPPVPRRTVAPPRLVKPIPVSHPRAVASTRRDS